MDFDKEMQMDQDYLSPNSLASWCRKNPQRLEELVQLIEKGEMGYYPELDGVGANLSPFADPKKNHREWIKNMILQKNIVESREV